MLSAQTIFVFDDFPECLEIVTQALLIEPRRLSESGPSVPRSVRDIAPDSPSSARGAHTSPCLAPGKYQGKWPRKRYAVPTEILSWNFPNAAADGPDSCR